MRQSPLHAALKNVLFLLLVLTGLALANAYFAPSALALTDCSTASAPCAEDPVIGDNNLCTGCHSITIVGGNRNGTDRPLTKSVASNRHVLDARLTNWTTTVTNMVGKGAGGGACDANCIAKAAAFLNTNYCPTCTGPITGSVSVSGVATSGATIGWATDVPATSCVIYGTTDPPSGGNTCNPGDPSYDPNNATMTQGHSVVLSNLSPSTSYYVVHQSASATGTATYTLARKFTTLDPIEPPTTGGPGTIISLAVGDYNNDSNADLGVGVSTLNTVVAYLGNGLGGFSEGQTLTNVGVKPLGITTGGIKADFDGDNVADLAVANFGEVANDILSNANVAIFLGTGAATPKPNPNNAFATTPVSTISLDATATGVEAGDFNNDGHMDIAVSVIAVDGSAGSVRIYLGDGTGHFGATPVTTIPVKIKPPTITIETITPNPDCLSLPFNVTATGTKLTDSAEYFLDDVTPLQIITFAADGTSVVLRIPASAVAGPHTIVAHLGADSATGNFNVNPRTVTFSSIFPSSVTYGASGSTGQQLTIQGLGFVVGSTVTVGTLSGTTVAGTSATAINPFVFVTSGIIRIWWPSTSMEPGVYNVSVTNNDACAGTVGVTGAFTVQPVQPTISSVSPTPVTYGVSISQSISVFGTNFLSGATVTLGSLSGTTVPGTTATASTPFVHVSSGVIRVWWPNTSLSPGSYTASVTNPEVSGGLSANLAGAFTVTAPQPTVAFVSPNTVTYGISVSQQVSVSGSNYLVGATVEVGGISCVTVAGATATAAVPCVVPAPSTLRFWWSNTSLPPGTYSVTVTNPIAAGELSGSLASSFTVNQAVPTVSSVSPASVAYGVTPSQSITIFGGNFMVGSVITVDGITGTTVAGSSATATTPFVYVNSSQVKFWWANTTLAPGNYTVTVTNPAASGGQSATLPATPGFTVTEPVPTVSTVSPASLIAGVSPSQSLTILGANFVLGATITIGGISGTTVFSTGTATASTPFVYSSAGTLRVWWPNTSLSPATYAVQVTNPAAAGAQSGSLANGFTVNAAQPTVTAASPATVTYGITSNLSITVFGTNFVVGSTITVGSLSGTTVAGSTATAANPFVFVNSSQVKFWWPNTSLSPGGYGVQVTNPISVGGLSGSMANAFTVNAPAPTISVAVPSPVASATAVSVTVTGSNFVLGATISVGGLSGTTVAGSVATASVPFVFVNSNTIRFWKPSGSPAVGSHNIQVTNPAAAGGLSATLTNGFVVN